MPPWATIRDDKESQLDSVIMKRYKRRTRNKEQNTCPAPGLPLSQSSTSIHRQTWVINLAQRDHKIISEKLFRVAPSLKMDYEDHFPAVPMQGMWVRSLVRELRSYLL